MLALAMLISLFLFVIILPIISLKKYYFPSKYGFFKNTFGVLFAIFTWPLVPINFAWRARDKWLILWYLVSFVVFIGVFYYWISENVEQFIALQQQVINQGLR